MSEETEDVRLVVGDAERGPGWSVLRRRHGALEAGEMRPLAEGQPIHGELVTLTRRREHDLLFDVKVVHDASGRGGPAQVATRAYRDGWEAAFGGDGSRGDEPN